MGPLVMEEAFVQVELLNSWKVTVDTIDCIIIESLLAQRTISAANAGRCAQLTAQRAPDTETRYD